MNILILGAGLMQKPAILAAKELGYKAVVIDADKNAVSIPYADSFYQIDLKDKEGILELAKKLQNDGGLKAVFTAGTDFSANVSYVCEKLGLPSHSYKAATNASIKTQMRQCFTDAKVPSPSFIDVTKDDFSLALTRTKGFSFPIVVKPVDNMGARGCRMVRSEKEFLPAVKIAVECSRSGHAIVEEYMDGPEFSIDALVHDGKFIITGFAERHIKYPPYFIEIGHTMPAILSKKMHDELISVFALGAKALGLTEGVAKADIKYTKNGPMIGEIAARLSGGYMSGWTYPYASDLNLTKQALLIASGKAPEDAEKRMKPVEFTKTELCKDSVKPYELYEVECLRTSAERAWMSIPGTVAYIENVEEFTDKAVFDVLPRATVSLGCKVDFPRNNVQKCGNIISVSHQHEIAVQASENAVSNTFITLKPDTKETDDFLNYKYQDDEENFPPSAFGRLTEKELSEIDGMIEKNESVEKNIPKILKSADYIRVVDWNFNTIEMTARKFDILRKNHPALDAKGFWSAVCRGGLQAAVYYSDTKAVRGE